MNLTSYIKSGFPFLAVETFEIKRALNLIKIDEGFDKFQWNMMEGIIGIQNGEQYSNPMELFEFGKNNTNSIFILENFNVLLEDEQIIQSVLNYMVKFEQQQTMFVIVGSNIKLPPQLEKIITKLELPFPKVEEFESFARELCDQTGIEYNQRAIDACKGMSFEEGKNTLTLSIVENRSMNPETILKAKRDMLKKTGFLDYMEPVPIEEVGGLENAKEYLYKRYEKWNDPKFPRLKSIFLGGVQGTGKSLFAKAVSSIFNCPLIIWDINACKGSLVGQTEQNMRVATKTIDAFGMSIVMVEEVDKIFGASTGQYAHSTDTGILGHWLTWLQESKEEKIVVCTANDINALPPEFMRRFDAQFFVDFPTKNGIREIIQIMNKKYGSRLSTDERMINYLIGWSGSEIEQLAKDSIFDGIETAILNVPLLKNIKGREIQELRNKYKTLMREANKPDIEEAKPTRSVAVDEPMLDEPVKMRLKQRLKLKSNN